MSRRELTHLIREQLLRHIDSSPTPILVIHLVAKIRSDSSERIAIDPAYLQTLIGDCVVFHRIILVLKELTDRGILVQSYYSQDGLYYSRP